MKLSVRIALLFVAFTIVFASSLMVTLWYVGKARVEDEDRRWVTLLTQSLSDTVARSVIDGDVVHAREVLLGIVGKSEEIRYIFIEGFDGEIVAHTFDRGFPRGLLGLGDGTGRVGESLIELSDGSQVSDISEPIIPGMSAKLHVGVNHKIATSAAAELVTDVALTLLVFSILGSLTGIIIGRRISAPLERVAQNMVAFGREGTFTPFNKRPTGAEELLLVSAFEGMAEGRLMGTDALHRREAALNDAQKIAHLGNWDWNIDNGDLWWSDEIFRIFGLDKAEFEASYEAFLETIHPDDRSKVTGAIDSAVTDNTPYVVRHRIVLPDGTERIVREQGEIYVSERTGHRHMSGIVHDITELELAFAGLRHKENVLAEAQRLAKIGHWESKADRSKTYWSDQLYKILSLSPDSAPLSREVFAEIIHPDDRPRFLDLIHLPPESDWPPNSEFRILVEGETKHIRINRQANHASDGSVDHIIGTVQDVSELDNVLKALRHNQTLLEDAQKIAKFGHWEVYPELQKVYWSDQLYRLFDLDPGSVTPTPQLMHEFLHPDDLEWFTAMEERAATNGWPPLTEFRVIVNGELKYIRMHVQVDLGGDGAIKRMYGTSQDITASKKMEATLLENQERLAQAQEIAHVGNFELDTNKGELWWSDEAYRIYGFEPQVTDINYDVWINAIHPDDRTYVADKAAGLLQGEPFETEYRIIRDDGQLRTIYAEGVLDVDVDGLPVLARGVMHDITERREALASSERLGRIIEDSTNEIYVFDTDTLKFTSVNRGARENLGYSMTELKEMTPVDIRPDYSLKDFQEIVQPLKDGRERVINFETIHQRKDGSLYDAEVRLQLTRKGHAPAFFASITDITDRLKAKESEQRLRQQLTHAARLSAVGGMATGLAHEINQPLSAISNYAQVCIRLMENGKGTTEEIIEDMRKISQQVARAAEIIKWLRKTVRREVADKSALDMNGCIREVIDLMGAEFRSRKSKIQFELSDGLPPVIANKVQIQQVLVNLFQNSLNAAQPRRLHSLVIKTGSADGEMIEIDVEDNGPGVPVEIQEDIFAPFFSTKGEGLGFGLAISRSIVEAHGGKLWLDTDFPEGAAFRFVVPVHDGEVA